MSFINQAAKTFYNLPEMKFQIVMFGRDALYIEGARPVKLDSDEMIFSVSGGLLTVTGENLEVKELDGDCTSVVGKIISIAMSDL